MDITLAPGTSLADMQLMLVPPGMAPGMWHIVERIMKESPPPGPTYYTLPQALERILEGKMQLWFAFLPEEEPEIFMITEILQYPAIKTLRLNVLAGKDWRRTKHLLEKVEKWAIFQGAQAVEADVRKGFVKWMQPLGYEPTVTTSIFKPLTTVH